MRLGSRPAGGAIELSSVARVGAVVVAASVFPFLLTIVTLPAAKLLPPSGASLSAGVPAGVRCARCPQASVGKHRRGPPRACSD